MSVTFRDSAIVLKISPQRDADRRYLVFTRQHGKLDLLAKGTRHGRSKMSPHMAWFGSVDIMIARGKYSDRLAGASLIQSYPGIMESLAKSSAAQAFMLTVDALTRREQPEERIFSLIEQYFSVLEHLSLPLGEASGNQKPLSDAANLQLLDIVGFGPELDRCVACRSHLDRGAAMNFFRGGLECVSCRQPDSLPLRPETVGRLRRFRSQSLMDSAVEPPPYQAVSQVLESLLAGHVGDRRPVSNFLRKVCA